LASRDARPLIDNDPEPSLGSLISVGGSCRLEARVPCLVALMTDLIKDSLPLTTNG
jgi:hypothetical protein